MEKNITIIPATTTTTETTTERPRRRVAAYARVSTATEEQENSFEAQKEYYDNYIRSNPDWIFVGIYADEGITGTGAKRRPGFTSMVEDALAGQIDLIITKSVSRFARNTVDSLTTIRKLKAKGVEVFFQKENIYTLDTKGELLLTIMSSLSQEESRSISENVIWGKRHSFQNGKVSVPFSSFLGYKRGKNGELVVDEDEAPVIRYIYDSFLAGDGFASIARKLKENGYKTPMGKTEWGKATIKSILTNEKYKGDAILQKTYSSDFLTKRKMVNNGELPKYYVESNHEGIVSREKWDMVQVELEKRKERHAGRADSVFNGKVECGCGARYSRKLWHSKDKYRRYVWVHPSQPHEAPSQPATPGMTTALENTMTTAEASQPTTETTIATASTDADSTAVDMTTVSTAAPTTVSMLSGVGEGSATEMVAAGEKLTCTLPHIREDKLREAFVKVTKRIMADKDAILDRCEHAIIAGCEHQLDAGVISTAVADITGQLDEICRSLEHTDPQSTDYGLLYDQYTALEEQLEAAERQEMENSARRGRIREYVEVLNTTTLTQSERVTFNGKLFSAAVEKVIVSGDKKKAVLRFVMVDGEEIEV